MMNLNKRYLVLVIAAAMSLSACDDGKDGKDGNDGEYIPPTVGTSVETKIELINHTIEDGKISFEFQAVNEDGVIIDGLQKAEAKFAIQTEKGIGLSRSGEGTLGGYGTFDATKDSNPEGASLGINEAGNYSFVMPMEHVKAGDVGIVWLRVGGAVVNDTVSIARSMPLIVDKPEVMHTTTTETCYSCHVDYATSDFPHPSYTAIDLEGKVDFVAGCMVCHGNISRTEENGGYAKNTLQKIGHINHQVFDRDFQVTNCYTCHAEPVMNTSIAGNGCVDCHASGVALNDQIAAFADDVDVRAIHATKSGIEERQQTRASHTTTLSAPYWDKDVTWTDKPTGAICTDLKLFKVEGETQTQLNIANLYGETLSYAGAYIHGYDSKHNTLVGRANAYGAHQYVEREDGTRSVCYPDLVPGFENSNLAASSRLTFALGDLENAGYTGVTLTSYSDVAETDYYEIADPQTTPPTFTDAGNYERRLAVTNDSCTSCHNSESNYHKNGSYQEGGIDCVACHNNGQDRKSKMSAPGFGPMVHSMHWGRGNTVNDMEGAANSADKLNAENCVACHADGIDLYGVPNQYIRAQAYHAGDTTKMSSPVLANCYACHDNDQALNHMLQNGGELSAEKGAGDDGEWYTKPTSESCATCHATGKTFAIEKYHVFER
ncbi:hypothetical protein [Shewanella sp. MBTL60-007]|uniref:multiheme c-type cytochrome n=1 Tax=Shewanella sp. MBTL60-007 TaxID=2815911 RepID=UPI001C81CE10|nr:hypothetical protein [Shewanella sp. MBTL60-007]